ncbi:MAG: ribulose-phosphate 3-epimerase [Treponema sp.]|jgi:ribulose-phosphate 3-epimerase|nr:ribulose-phosphate 3-epimerase [Treponema sp.]
MSKFILSPSILAADFTNLGESLRFIESKKADWVHIDVMDGSFVPNITFGQPVVSALRKISNLQFDVHLMIENPQLHISSFVEAGADLITFHYEAAVHHHRIVQQIHNLEKKAGISIVPSTPVSVLQDILPFVDLVLIMSVNPGFGGQTLIPRCIEKIAQLDELRSKNGYNFRLSVDGGINNKTIGMAVDAGADVIVSGSSFFSGDIGIDRK